MPASVVNYNSRYRNLLRYNNSGYPFGSEIFFVCVARWVGRFKLLVPEGVDMNARHYVMTIVTLKWSGLGNGSHNFGGLQAR